MLKSYLKTIFYIDSRGDAREDSYNYNQKKTARNINYFTKRKPQIILLFELFSTAR